MSVEGVVRVVCGLSLNTSCQDVVIALAQSTGRVFVPAGVQNESGSARDLCLFSSLLNPSNVCFLQVRQVVIFLF